MLIVKPSDRSKKKYIDVINDERLFEVFKEAVKDKFIIDEKLDLSNIDKISEQFESSMLMGEKIDEHIRNKRLRRITEILQSAYAVDDALKFTAEELGSHFADLIEKYQDTEDVERFINTLLEAKPEFFENIKAIRAVQERIDALQKKEQKIYKEIEDAERKLESVKENSEGLKQQGHQYSDEEIAEKERILKEIEALQPQLGDIQNVVQLRKTKEKLEKDVEQLKKDVGHNEWRERQLKEENSKLQAELAKSIDAYNVKMHEVALDGFVANKMMEASSEWETKNIMSSYEDLVKQMNSLQLEELQPKELVDYLYKVISIARPTYEKNTIINLAICFTQGFLTVLAGEPGCGKTSICDLYAKSLGLDKIRKYIHIENRGIDTSRYIPISVERGWTSKRDLIGYYNPLTKTFDKSSRQIFDALQILDKEKIKFDASSIFSFT